MNGSSTEAGSPLTDKSFLQSPKVMLRNDTGTVRSSSKLSFVSSTARSMESLTGSGVSQHSGFLKQAETGAIDTLRMKAATEELRKGLHTLHKGPQDLQTSPALQAFAAGWSSWSGTMPDRTAAGLPDEVIVAIDQVDSKELDDQSKQPEMSCEQWRLNLGKHFSSTAFPAEEMDPKVLRTHLGTLMGAMTELRQRVTFLEELVGDAAALRAKIAASDFAAKIDLDELKTSYKEDLEELKAAVASMQPSIHATMQASMQASMQSRLEQCAKLEQIQDLQQLVKNIGESNAMDERRFVEQQSTTQKQLEYLNSLIVEVSQKQSSESADSCTKVDELSATVSEIAVSLRECATAIAEHPSPDEGSAIEHRLSLLEGRVGRQRAPSPVRQVIRQTVSAHGSLPTQAATSTTAPPYEPVPTHPVSLPSTSQAAPTYPAAPMLASTTVVSQYNLPAGTTGSYVQPAPGGVSTFSTSSPVIAYRAVSPPRALSPSSSIFNAQRAPSWPFVAQDVATSLQRPQSVDKPVFTAAPPEVIERSNRPPSPSRYPSRRRERRDFC